VQVLQLTALLAIAQFASLAISTNAIVSTPPHASARLPLDVVAMLRTTPPPEGIGHRSNFSLLGSTATTQNPLDAPPPAFSASCGIPLFQHVADRLTMKA